MMVDTESHGDTVSGERRTLDSQKIRSGDRAITLHEGIERSGLGTRKLEIETEG